MESYINDKSLSIANTIIDKLSTLEYYEILDNNNTIDEFKAGFNVKELAYFVGSLLNNKNSKGKQIMYALGKYWSYTISNDELEYSSYRSIEDIKKQENSNDGRSYNLDGGDLDLEEVNINNDDSIIECAIYLLTE